jgi:hypothetical protein
MTLESPTSTLSRRLNATQDQVPFELSWDQSLLIGSIWTTKRELPWRIPRITKDSKSCCLRFEPERIRQQQIFPARSSRLPVFRLSNVEFLVEN